MDEPSNWLWLFAVAGGPLLLIIAFVYAFTRNKQHRKGAGERAAQEAATEEIYRDPKQ